jgi:hypothetical protein
VFLQLAVGRCREWSGLDLAATRTLQAVNDRFLAIRTLGWQCAIDPKQK